MTFYRVVKIQAKTWLKDSGGAFDYDSSDHKKVQLTFLGSSNFYQRVTNHIEFVTRKNQNVNRIEPIQKKYIDQNNMILSIIYS